jgi:hypothetical protein
VLALVGLGLRNTPAGIPADELKAQIDQNIERLAETEHDGWMAHRSRNGWRWAETRDDARKLHPDMLAYAKLPEREKSEDRNTIRHYEDIAERAGYRIVVESSRLSGVVPWWFPDRPEIPESGPCSGEKPSLFGRIISLFAKLGNFGRKCLI